MNRWKLHSNALNHIYYFEDLKTSKKDSNIFNFASDYHNGYALVRKNANGKYQFRDLEGNLSQTFDKAYEYVNGFARVYLSENPVIGQQAGWRIRDLDGNLSEPFEMIYDYSDGYCVVMNSDKLFMYRDKLGNLSEKFIAASTYKEGFALVTPLNSKYKQFRDKDGKLSVKFQNAKPYKEGFAVIKKKSDIGFRYRDKFGNLSEDAYFEANSYENGFAVVRRTKSSNLEYRDLLGNLSFEQSKIGIEIYEYINGRKSVFELSLDCFGNDKFLKKIMEYEQLLLEQTLSYCESEHEINELYDLVEYTGEYIKDKVVEYYKNNERNNIYVEKRKVVNKSEVEDAIQKMF